MTTRRAVLAVLVLSGLTACASTGVVPVGNGEYMISKESAAGVFGTPAGVEADIYRTANAYCAKRHEALETVNVQALYAVPFVREGSATLHFRCKAAK